MDTRRNVPGTSACAIAAARYQRGTKISARSRSIARTTLSATRSGPTTTRLNRPPQQPVLREAFGVHEPGVDRVHVDPARPKLARDRAGEGELCVLRGRVRPDRDRSRDGDDVHQVRRSRSLERGQERLEAPDRAEVVDPDQLLDSLRRQVEVVAAPGHARVVHEQSDLGMALADGGRHPLDGAAIGNVADLVFAADFARPSPAVGPRAGRRARRANRARPACSRRLRRCRTRRR